MVTGNAAQLDHAKHTVYYRENLHHVLVPLPFTVLTLEDETQYWQPVSSFGLVNERGQRRTGSNVAMVVLKRNMRLPRPPGQERPEKHAVWEYYGA